MNKRLKTAKITVKNEERHAGKACVIGEVDITLSRLWNVTR